MRKKVKAIFDPDASTDPSDSEDENDAEIQEIYECIEEMDEVHFADILQELGTLETFEDSKLIRLLERRKAWVMGIEEPAVFPAKAKNCPRC